MEARRQARKAPSGRRIRVPEGRKCVWWFYLSARPPGRRHNGVKKRGKRCFGTLEIEYKPLLFNDIKQSAFPVGTYGPLSASNRL
jgi:hypothetical protein